MIIFGASGDLTKRKLMPALYSLYREKRLTGEFSILGIGRTIYSDDNYRSYILEELQQFVKSEEQDTALMASFVFHLYYLPMDPAKEEGYPQLRQRLVELTNEVDPDNLLFYLATPPSLYGVVPIYLKAAGLNTPHSRIIVEKPFGYDLESALELNKTYASVFNEHQIYRIDHFLGKETAQNVLAFRFANGIFEPLWNRNYIDYVEITAVENLGIEQRGGFYETAGALRDMVQNHLIQLVALTAMEPPAVFNADNFRNEVVKVYESLTPLNDVDLNEHIVRGQYTASGSKKGYREEKGVAPDSRTETYIAMKLGISNWRWSGVPFYIRTGKQMPTKVTEIVVHFRETPHQMFHCASGNCPRANKLILRLQPNEGIVLKIGMKVPGAGFEVRQVTMDFSYAQLGGVPSGDAYARLIDDCIQGDPTLFTRSDAVEASWKFFDPVLRYCNSAEVIDALGANRQAFSMRTAAELLRMPRFWGFIIYVVGVASVYDVFDQQFANFFKGFFSSPQRGTEVFGFVTTGGELLNALIMFCAPAIINRIGAKNALLIAGMIMSVRILGSSFANSAVEVIILKMLHMFEIPFLLVGTFKYISSAFNPKLSATLFLIGFNLSKQLSGVVLSAWVGRMYDTVGFHQAYLILGCITLSFTLISLFTLKGSKTLLPAAA